MIKTAQSPGSPSSPTLGGAGVGDSSRRSPRRSPSSSLQQHQHQQPEQPPLDENHPWARLLADRGVFGGGGTTPLPLPTPGAGSKAGGVGSSAMASQHHSGQGSSFFTLGQRTSNSHQPPAGSLFGAPGSSHSATSSSTMSAHSHSQQQHTPSGAAGGFSLNAAALNLIRKRQTAPPSSSSPPGSGSSSSSGGSIRGKVQSSSSLRQDLAFQTKVKPIDTQRLARLLHEEEKENTTGSKTLLIDIRPSTSFRNAHVRGSINVCAPSTLLKRRAVTIQRIEQDLLGSVEPADREQFERWRAPTRPTRRIVVLDLDTQSLDDGGRPSAGGGGACLAGLLQKFDDAGYEGELGWLAGGFKNFIATEEAKRWVEGTGGGGGDEKSASHSSMMASPVVILPPAETHSGPSNPATPAPTRGGRRVSAPFFSKGFGFPSFRSSQPAGGTKASNSSSENNGASSPKPAGETNNSGNGMSSPQTRHISNRVQPRGLPMEAFTTQSTVKGSAPFSSPFKGFPSGSASVQSAGMEGNEQQQQAGQDAGEGGRQPNTATANPFFDNIRQNRELAHGVTETIPLDLPAMTQEEKQALPRFLQRLIDMPSEKRAQTLAQNFYDIDRAEQDRLNATMRQHADESSVDPRNSAQQQQPQSKETGKPEMSSPQAGSCLSSPYCSISLPGACSAAGERFPFSIAAALERGADNRYNNIWTYEHSRVRLAHPQQMDDPGSDYLNGSFVEPARRYGSQRRFIATQAPLPSTFNAFWQAIWEHNSRVVVMLSREQEGGRVQCHDYWTQPFHGKVMKTELVDEVRITADGKILDEADSTQDSAGDGGFFSTADSGSASSKTEAAVIRRTIKVWHTARPDQSPRHIIQYQYLEWPDYFVPDSSSSLLNLVELADHTQDHIDQELAAAQGSLSQESSARSGSLVGPMVVHCSAGVGRTGAFVVINSLLDVLRRERRPVGSLSCWDDGVKPVETRFAYQSFDVQGSDERRGSRLSSSGSTSTRRSRKRELSPSASIDTDSSDADGLASPPSFRRTRSRENTSEDQFLRRSSPLATPSRALHGMHLTHSSPPPPTSDGQTPMEGIIQQAESGTRQEAPDMAREQSTASNSSGVSSSGISYGESSSSVASSGNVSSLLFQRKTPSSHQIPSVELVDTSAMTTEVDLVKQTTETVREQRMSTVQTTRQYVFVHLAVLEGCLRDHRRLRGE